MKTKVLEDEIVEVVATLRENQEQKQKGADAGSGEAVEK